MSSAVLAGAGAGMALAIGALAALGVLGWSLWRTAPDRARANSELGTGVLVSVVVAAAVGGTQFAVDDRRRDADRARERAAARAAAQQDLRLAVGLQRNVAGIDLSGQDLTGFYLTGKNLTGAVLTNARLRGADFAGARLREANMAGADLRAANLAEVDLSGANLQSADLRDATLIAARFVAVDLSGANLSGANLSDANLSDANLRQAKLTGVNLQLANLRGATLDDVDFERADLYRADLRKTKLNGADLRRVRLSATKLDDSVFDSRTRWAADFDARAAGARPRTCKLPKGVLRLRFSAALYPNIKAHVQHAIARGWPKVLVLNRVGADTRHAKLFDATGLTTNVDHDEYPPAVGRGSANDEAHVPFRSLNPIGWMADVELVPSEENRSQGARMGSMLSDFCDGTRFQYAFSGS